MKALDTNVLARSFIDDPDDSQASDNGGLDFAAALHLHRSGRASGFVTFDKRLAKRANALGILPRVELLR